MSLKLTCPRIEATERGPLVESPEVRVIDGYVGAEEGGLKAAVKYARTSLDRRCYVVPVLAHQTERV